MRIALFTVFAVVLTVLPGCDSEKSDTRDNFARGNRNTADSSSALAVSSRQTLRDSLRLRGMYECCTKPECLECAENPGRCDCYNDIQRKDPICGECLDGYKRGEGRLKLTSIPELEKIRQDKKR